MIPDSIKQFADAVSKKLDVNLVSVVMVGSFARGDQTSESDVDLCILVNKINSEILREIGKLVNSISSENEINPAVVSLEEFRTYPDQNKRTSIYSTQNLNNCSLTNGFSLVKIYGCPQKT